MPKPAYAVTCYRMFFEVSHHIRRIGRAVVLHLSHTCRVRCRKVGACSSASLSCDDRTQLSGIPGNLIIGTLCQYLGATSSKGVILLQLKWTAAHSSHLHTKTVNAFVVW